VSKCKHTNAMYVGEESVGLRAYASVYWCRCCGALKRHWTGRYAIPHKRATWRQPRHPQIQGQ
jgi:hypothetical protein